eukprot:CAMPEP_0178387186 /NCGR_PEP_ID=MMETSP0689_2-20121128/8945_1 /TAXON_ID=160604 /ORGANISM="Amphidinium massartii, Strain CS-259" /LENGTH=198 /DNA_ID=CAMNT_0020007545 /DNA_START=172 /DNA_END=770 /DNA_ORIENTATION=+
MTSRDKPPINAMCSIGGDRGDLRIVSHHELEKMDRPKMSPSRSVGLISKSGTKDMLNISNPTWIALPKLESALGTRGGVLPTPQDPSPRRHHLRGDLCPPRPGSGKHLEPTEREDPVLPTDAIEAPQERNPQTFLQKVSVDLGIERMHRHTHTSNRCLEGDMTWGEIVVEQHERRRKVNAKEQQGEVDSANVQLQVVA